MEPEPPGTADMTPKPAPHPGGSRPHQPGPKTRRAARDAAVLSIAEIAGKIATLAFTIAAARILTTEDFGAFAYALAFSLLVAAIPTWGFDPLLTQRGSAEPGRLSTHFSETIAWRTALTIPVFLAAGAAGFAQRPNVSSGIALVLVLAAGLIDNYSHAGRAAASAKQDQFGMAVALVAQRMVTAVLAIGALVAGGGLVGLSAAYLVGTAVGLVGVWMSLRQLGVGPTRQGLTREGLLRTGRMSVSVGIAVVISMVLFRVDQLILEALKGEAALGTYAAAYRLFETVLFVSWAMRRTIFPVISAGTETWRLKRGLEQGVAALAVLYVPFGVGIWVEAGPILNLLYGEPYATAAASAARWLAPSPIFFAISYLAGAVLLARERRWLNTAGVAIAAAFNVGANLILIPRLSGTGAAIATTTSYALLSVLLLAFAFPEVGLVRLDRSVALPVIAAAVMGAVLAAAPLPIVPEVLLGIVIYSGLWLMVASRWAPEQVSVIRAVLPWRR